MFKLTLIFHCDRGLVEEINDGFKEAIISLRALSLKDSLVSSIPVEMLNMDSDK